MTGEIPDLSVPQGVAGCRLTKITGIFIVEYTMDGSTWIKQHELPHALAVALNNRVVEKYSKLEEDVQKKHPLKPIDMSAILGEAQVRAHYGPALWKVLFPKSGN